MNIASTKEIRVTAMEKLARVLIDPVAKTRWELPAGPHAGSAIFFQGNLYATLNRTSELKP